MTEILKCPFCGSELENACAQVIYFCPKDECDKTKDWYASKQVWRALIAGKKAQDALKVARNLYQELALAYCEMVDDYRTTYGCLKTPEQETQEYMQEYDEKITSITKQEE